MRPLFWLLLAVGLAAGSCKKKTEFMGTDNFITSFSLKKGGTTFTAAITDTSIVITAPDGFSLDSAKATIALSENSSIYPKPDSIVEWDDQFVFIVNAHNGFRRAYTYSIKRTVVPISGSVVLATQADVDAFAKTGASEITGNLIIGRPGGTDSITNLNGLFKLKKVGYSLIIYPTYSGQQILGLDNLQSVGGTLQIEGLNDLVSLSLPALQTASSISVKNVIAESIAFPKLVSVEKTMTLDDPLNVLSLPNLASVGGLLTLNTDASTGAALIQNLSFPMLKTAGGISIANFKQTTKLDLPVLSSTADLYLDDLTALYNLNVPALQTATGTITIPGPSKLAQLSFPSLTTAGGLNISGQGINSADFPVLKTVTKDLSIKEVALDGLANFPVLSMVMGQLSVQDLPKMTGLHLPVTLKTIGKLSIFNINVLPLAEIDVRNLSIGELNVQVRGSIKLIGDDVFKGTLTVAPVGSGTFPLLQGFSEVDSLSFNGFISSISDLQVKGIRKINKSFTLPNNNVRTFGMPDLQEVGGDFVINQFQQLNQATVEVPGLQTVGGNFSVLVQSTVVTTLKLTALVSVGGNLTVATGYSTRSLTALSFPVLTTVGGQLKVYGELAPSQKNTKLTNLDGFSALTAAKSVVITGQSVLTSFQGLQKVIPSITASDFTASNNSYNPTYAALTAGQWTP